MVHRLGNLKLGRNIKCFLFFLKRSRYIASPTDSLDCESARSEAPLWEPPSSFRALHNQLSGHPAYDGTSYLRQAWHERGIPITLFCKFQTITHKHVNLNISCCARTSLCFSCINVSSNNVWSLCFIASLVWRQNMRPSFSSALWILNVLSSWVWCRMLATRPCYWSDDWTKNITAPATSIAGYRAT